MLGYGSKQWCQLVCKRQGSGMARGGGTVRGGGSDDCRKPLVRIQALKLSSAKNPFHPASSVDWQTLARLKDVLRAGTPVGLP